MSDKPPWTPADAERLITWRAGLRAGRPVDRKLAAARLRVLRERGALLRTQRLVAAGKLIDAELAEQERRALLLRVVGLLNALPRLCSNRLPMDSERSEAIIGDVCAEIRSTLAAGRKYIVSEGDFEAIVRSGFEACNLPVDERARMNAERATAAPDDRTAPPDEPLPEVDDDILDDGDGADDET